MWPQGLICYGSNVIYGKALHKHSIHKQFFLEGNWTEDWLTYCWRPQRDSWDHLSHLGTENDSITTLYSEELFWWLECPVLEKLPPILMFLIIKGQCQPSQHIQYHKTVGPTYRYSSVNAWSTAKVSHQTASSNFCVFILFVELVVPFYDRKTIFKLLSNCTAPPQKDYASFIWRYTGEHKVELLMEKRIHRQGLLNLLCNSVND